MNLEASVAPERPRVVGHPMQVPAALTRGRAIGLLALFAILQVALSAGWMRSNGFFTDRPPFQDASYWRVDSWRMMQAWKSGGITEFLRAGLEYDESHPPLLPMLAALTSLPEGEVSVESQWRVEMMFLAVLPFIAYRLARNFGSRRFSVFAAAIMSSAPVFLVSARVFYPKFPATVLVLAALDALLRSRGFERIGWAVAFGALSGIAALAFMLAPAYLIGSAVGALVVGLMIRGRRPRVIGGAAAALATMVLVASLWYARHWERPFSYAMDVTSGAGQERFSHGVGLSSVERWVFYPRALVNSGLGFFPSVAIAVAFVTWTCAPRSWKEAPAVARHRSGLILLTGAIVSFLLVVPGQVAGYSEYVMSLAPLALLFAAWSISTLRKGLLRVGLFAFLGVTCAFTMTLAYRPLDFDRVGWRLGPFHVIDMYDRYGGVIAQDLGCRADPAAEVWPIESLLDMMIERSPSQEIRLGQALHPYLHAYLNSGNFTYAALKRGEVVRTVHIPPLATLDAPAAARLANDIDFLVIDREFAKGRDPNGDMARFLDMVGQSGIRVHTVACETVTPRSEAVLIQFARPGERPPAEPRGVLDEGSIRRTDVRFANGWRLVGVETVRRPDGDGVINTFWDMNPPGEPGFEAFVQVGDASHTLGTGFRSLAPRGHLDPDDLFVCGIPCTVPAADPALQMRLGLRLLGRGQQLSDHSRHVESNLPGFGDFMVVLPR